ncbi:hypothetical protein W03_11290 [Nitrosomonas sp. PY1]|nr:hypothetical protein W03_11290 [Nitrosomonas sp. PY1]
MKVEYKLEPVEYKPELDSNYSSVVGNRNGIEYVVGCTSYTHLNDDYDDARDGDDLDDARGVRDVRGVRGVPYLLALM